MKLSPDERRKIYEEEKAKIESEQKHKNAESESTTELPQNVAGLLCYVAGWITGIVFLVIEQKNVFVRFHAIQSIVVFGTLTIASALLSWIPVVGVFFGAVIGILAFVLWIVLMIKAYQGELYKVPIAGVVAGAIFSATGKSEKPEAGKEQETTEPVTSNEALKENELVQPTTTMPKKGEEFGRRIEEYFARTKTGRIVGYSAAIFWNVALLIFLSFFYKYIAWYHVEADGSVTRLPMLTNDYLICLPVLVTALILSITANVILIIYDKYWLREAIQIILNIIGIAVVATLVSIFPFDFSVIPNATAVDVVPIVVTILLVLTAVGLGVGTVVRFIKLIGNTAKQEPS